MFDINFDRRPGECSPSRRHFLRVGGLSALGLTLPRLLAAEASAESASGAKPRAKSVILVYLGGGLSHHDTFDLKPEAPAEIRGKYSPIPSSVPGLVVGELLPKMAKVMHKVALVRSGTHNNDHHETATNWVLSGRFGSPFGDFPAIGAVAAHELGFAGALPPYVAIPQNPSFTWELGKSAFLGGRYESFKVGDPNSGDFKVRDVAPLEQLEVSRVERRQNLLSVVDSLARRVEANDQLATYDEFHKRAATMILSPESRSAFNMSEEADALRDRYGRNTFGQSCLMARRLVERGVRFATVNFAGWDHHAKIWDGLEQKLPMLDAGLSSLIDDMESRGMLSDTLVAVFGEFGRTPKINKDTGRDHWAPAASLLFAGAGVQPGRVIGSTDKEGARANSDPVSPADVCYTILESLGVNPRKTLTTADGRPIEILDQGRTITQLYG